MASPSEWARGYARQAQADFLMWQALEEDRDVQLCHRMMFLQMACEKLCKARLIHQGTLPSNVQTSHGYIAKPLPLIIRAQLEFMGWDLRARDDLYHFARRLSPEIELMNPSVDRNGQRPDNCEYPWEDAVSKLHSPLDWSFNPARILRNPLGPSFIKLLRLAMDRAVEEMR
ncbi:MAG: hypothetical protein ABS79_05230 [Planctomycetes bacterium SCN 63-9]|nr:MAG: hypothetical protein ABS79_05230 [Planctomycetes bacterium SCN 63-9]